MAEFDEFSGFNEDFIAAGWTPDVVYYDGSFDEYIVEVIGDFLDDFEWGPYQ